MSALRPAPAAEAVAAPAPAHDAPRVLPARHPWRWAATVLVAAVLVAVGHALVTNEAWDWPTVGDYVLSATVLHALWFTVQLTLGGTVLGFALGTVVALMRMSRARLLRVVATAYTSVFRSVPLILQLLFWYNLAILAETVTLRVPFGGPVLVSVPTMELVGPVTAAFLGIGLHQAAYCAEIVRSGFLSIPAGQREAAAALGIPRWRQFRRILLPQALRVILPTAANEVIGLFKGTSVVYIMALPELFYQVQVIYNRTGRVIPMLLVAAIWYFVLTSVLTLAQTALERHLARGERGRS